MGGASTGRPTTSPGWLNVVSIEPVGRSRVIPTPRPLGPAVVPTSQIFWLASTATPEGKSIPPRSTGDARPSVSKVLSSVPLVLKRAAPKAPALGTTGEP